ncbi:MAG: metalloregulator ArsR/SmtB family transcription factor [Gammaproteobacteria bacterium]|nr:metalloregulator ArsR/SmtB family transcription factor [Gammaproteobacteria bacterium]NIR88806.1 metalloregulator ArsR/SmtB family transcription factor [Gammaproteobacteria bacterium]NIU06419.1 metalloregulator ArsR/SmtB family transcription factor [Gammaproteobacteria bacterium]NIV53311.1 metalloregulator ArsR/SmtB family transcription factor [Gammaproteobacteria bacterium]NIX87692.1 metalloregulator ArsR/SmtB family transcription factor [Gammaproteobacteria bacterium]
MSSSRQSKDLLYEQVARIGKAVSSPKRLELIEILCQGDKSVEQLAADAEISVKLTSAHLKELKAARLVEARREGKHMIYRLIDPQVVGLWVGLRTVAEERLVELRVIMRELVERPDELSPVSGRGLLRKAKQGDVVVLDVRPETEFRAAHLPHARSIPLSELRKRLEELPTDRPVVAYCRGPFCLMAKEAVALLNKKGFHATHLEDGVAEWGVRGLPLAKGGC